MNGNANTRIHSFDGLRFFIIVLLIIHHFDCFNDLAIPGWSLIMKYFNEGYLSVNFFFILSGYCIAEGYEHKILAKECGVFEFLYYRLIHLLPTYWLCLLIATRIYSGVLLPHFNSGVFWSHILLLQSWLPNSQIAFSYNGVAWSISAEIAFYLGFASIVGSGKRWRTFIFFVLWGVIAFSCLSVGMDISDATWFYYINPLFRFADFLTGWIIHDIRSHKNKYSEKIKGTSLEIISIIILLLSIWLAVNRNISWLWKWQIWYTPSCALLIFAFSFNKGIISGFLGKPVLRYLGRLAFPMYLTHQIVLNIIKRVLLPYMTSVKSLVLAGCCGIIVSLIVSILLDQFFTSPITKKLRGLLKTKWKDSVR